MNAAQTADGKADRMNDAILAVARIEDRAAFQEVFEFFAPRVKAFVMRQGSNPQAAEEVVQETMVNVWRKAKQFDPTKAQPRPGYSRSRVTFASITCARRTARNQI